MTLFFYNYLMSSVSLSGTIRKPKITFKIRKPNVVCLQHFAQPHGSSQPRSIGATTHPQRVRYLHSYTRDNTSILNVVTYKTNESTHAQNPLLCTLLRCMVMNSMLLWRARLVHAGKAIIRGWWHCNRALLDGSTVATSIAAATVDADGCCCRCPCCRSMACRCFCLSV